MTTDNFERNRKELDSLFSDTEEDVRWFKWSQHPEHGLLVWEVEGPNGLPFHKDMQEKHWATASNAGVSAGRLPVGPDGILDTWKNAEDLVRLDEHTREELFDQVDRC